MLLVDVIAEKNVGQQDSSIGGLLQTGAPILAYHLGLNLSGKPSGLQGKP